MQIREASSESDHQAVLEIYNRAIVSSVATFDIEPYTMEQRREWFAQFGGEFPLFVAELDGRVVGFAYYLPYRAKAGYDLTRETTVYIAEGFQKRGVGSALYETLIARARERGIHALIAVLGGKNVPSEALHLKFGFERIGHYREVGRKFGEWVDIHTFQKLL